MVLPLEVHGVDLSHNNSGIDLKVAKSRGLKWVSLKATEGTTIKDTMYNTRRKAAAEAKLLCGAYHFARADRGDAVKEARFFLDYAKPKPGDMKPGLDLETKEGMNFDELRTWIINFSAEVKRQIGVLPILYSPWNFHLKGYIRWVPRYNRDNRRPDIPWDIHQFSGGAATPGTPSTYPGVGAVDLNNMAEDLLMREITIPPEPDKLTVVTFNMYVGNKEPRQNLRELTRATDDPDVLFLQEAKNWNGALHDYQRFEKQYQGRPEADSSIMLIRDDHKLWRDRSIKVGGPDWVGPKHNIKHKPRVFPGVTAEVRDRRWDLLCVHRNPGGPDSRNSRAWAAEHKALLQWAGRLENFRPMRPAGWGGDWNDRMSNTDPMSVSRLARQVEGELVLRGIDGFLGIGCDVKKVRELERLFGSDGHNPVYAELEA